jgi:hypothetical protein
MFGSKSVFKKMGLPMYDSATTSIAAVRVGFSLHNVENDENVRFPSLLRLLEQELLRVAVTLVVTNRHWPAR